MSKTTINLNDLIGQKFGRLTILSAKHDKDDSLHPCIICTCQCECGSVKEYRYERLKKGHTKSCGCIQKIELDNLIGQKFGRLTVVAANRKKKTTRWRIYCICECECGTIKEIAYDSLRTGETISCGCLRLIDAAKNHPERSKKALYKIWQGMKDRCYNPNSSSYKYYHDNGITICDEWLNSLDQFVKWSLNNNYSPALTLDRIDYKGNYEPSNCRWVTFKTQNNNKENNLYITIDNCKRSLSQWCEIYQIEYDLVRHRIIDLKWDPQRALTAPIRAMTYNSDNKLRNIWNGMKGRCYTTSNLSYPRYGGKGITICDEWRNSFETFERWALANGYTNELTLDRINNDGNYEPSNCRWVNAKVQNNNRTNNINITINNETKTLAQWCEVYQINYKIVHLRITRLKWNPERALTTPIKKLKKRTDS